MQNPFSQLFGVKMEETNKMLHTLNKIDEHILKRIAKDYLASREIQALSKRDISLQLLTAIEKLVEINYQLETILSEFPVEIPNQDHATFCKQMPPRCLENAMPSQTLCLNATTDTGTMPFMKCCSNHQPPPEGFSGDCSRDNAVVIAGNGTACRSAAPQQDCDDQRTKDLDKNYCATFIHKVGNSREVKNEGKN